MVSQITPLEQLRLDPPLYDRFAQLTRQCCVAARDCCRITLLSSSNSPKKDSRKMCSDTGWVSRPGTGSEWTDYSGCSMDQQISCRLLFLVQLRFLRLATFSWMLAEGVYLFRLLQSDSAEGEDLIVYKVLCWGVPAAIAIVYGILRESLDSKGCWVSPSANGYIESSVTIPCILALSVYEDMNVCAAIKSI
ncbi:hypothetical protein RB195_011992 [Necator americanus]|uniref:G-protein coupled receptors family 2 profile 2 domain-containing protein n=1 Tax=Necator americanus TaxID=51031 RepID=A0ABR1D5T9_NECAM